MSKIFMLPGAGCFNRVGVVFAVFLFQLFPLHHAVIAARLAVQVYDVDNVACRATDHRVRRTFPPSCYLCRVSRGVLIAVQGQRRFIHRFAWEYWPALRRVIQGPFQQGLRHFHFCFRVHFMLPA